MVNIKIGALRMSLLLAKKIEVIRKKGLVNFLDHRKEV